jgi:hypothetical protein
MKWCVLFLVGLLFILSPVKAQEGERKWELVKTIPSQDGSMKLEVYATAGEWPIEKVMVRNSKTGKKRDLDYGHDGLSLQGSPLISTGGRIIVITIGGGSYGTEPCILRKEKGGVFKKLEMADPQEDAWKCAIKAKVFPGDADPDHIYLHAFAIDEKMGLVKIAVQGNATFQRAIGKFEKGRNNFGPFGVCYDYNHGTWKMMKELPKNWEKQMEPVRTASEPVVQPDE